MIAARSFWFVTGVADVQLAVDDLDVLHLFDVMVEARVLHRARVGGDGDGEGGDEQRGREQGCEGGFEML